SGPTTAVESEYTKVNVAAAEAVHPGREHLRRILTTAEGSPNPPRIRCGHAAGPVRGPGARGAARPDRHRRADYHRCHALPALPASSARIPASGPTAQRPGRRRHRASSPGPHAPRPAAGARGAPHGPTGPGADLAVPPGLFP